ncbi:MAG: ankyrin repeat domain-containing protein [Oscillospiraceae bacterium]|nr:ankyrin repeat domain-containing protein [Oscillospiraceae bacterium]
MDKNKIVLTIISVIAAILMCFKIHYDAEKFFCKQMLGAIETEDIPRLKEALFFGDPNSVLGISWIEGTIGETGTRQTPLQATCKKGNIDMVKLLVKGGADVNYTPLNAVISPIQYAAESQSNNNLEIVKYLLGQGADVNYECCVGHGIIVADFLARRSLEPNGMEILKELMKEVEDKQRELYLRNACYWKHEEVIRFFVEEYGFDASDEFYLCAYCYGRAEYSRETFEYFLKRGADPYARDEYGKCAIDYLKESPAPEWAETVAEMAKEYGFEG